MIQEENRIEIEKTEGLLEETFGIDPQNISHILGILRDKLYSDKSLAVVREYATNAYDAHIEAGIPERPIEISLPNNLNPMLCIRDFGKGMSPKEIKQTYIQYGSSTKRSTNSQNGMWGIGSKAAFCYTDTFNVISYFDGFKNEYCCYIDETRCGKISLLDTSETEETGIEIRIPVKQKDWDNFAAKIKYNLCYMNPLPLVDGKELEGKEIKYQLDLEEKSKIIFTEDYSTYVIMGGIPYKIDYDKIYNPDGNYTGFRNNFPKEYDLTRKDPSLVVPIGSIDIVPSREGLEYTQKTVSFIKKIFNSAQEKITEDITNSTSVAKTFREARELYVKNSKYLYKDEDKVIYKGEIINDKVLRDRFSIDEKVEDSEEKDGIETVSYDCSIYRKDYNKFPSYNTVFCHSGRENNFKFIEIDIPHQWKSKINKWWETDDAKDYNVQETIFVNFGDKIVKQKFFKKYHLDEYEWVKLSELNIPKTERTWRPSSGRTSHLGQIFLYKDYQWDRDAHNVKSELWEKVKDDKKVDNSRKRYYVLLDRFKLVGFNYDKLNKYIKIIKEEENKDIELSDIIGIKQKYKDKIESHWINLEERAKELLKKYKDDFYWLANASKCNLNISVSEDIPNSSEVKDKDSLFLKFIEYQKLYKQKKEKIAKLLGSNYKYPNNGWSWNYPERKEDLRKDLQNLTKKLIENYPLLHDAFTGYNGYNHSEHKTLYINLIDEYNKKQKESEKKQCKN